MAKHLAVIGYGPVGRALAQRLGERGDVVRIVQRRTPAVLPKGCDFQSGNVEVQEEAVRACASVDTVVCAVGVPYVSSVYVPLWPKIMKNLLDGCEASGARFVFADNLYVYGPQMRPLREDLPLTTYGRKPRARAEVTRLWQAAHSTGHVVSTAVRAADFYGPDVSTSVVSTYGVARLLKGKSALAPYPPDNPHDFTYVPDFARALVSLIDAPDDAYGQAWHVPNAPTRTLRDIFALAAKLIGVRPRVTILPQWLNEILGLFRKDVYELREMRFQWDRPYLVDTTKFRTRFWGDATSFDEGLGATIEYYKGI